MSADVPLVRVSSWTWPNASSGTSTRGAIAGVADLAIREEAQLARSGPRRLLDDIPDLVVRDIARRIAIIAIRDVTDSIAVTVLVGERRVRRASPVVLVRLSTLPRRRT